MTVSFAAMSVNQYQPSEDESVFDSIFEQYRRVIIESLITSFGLNFIMGDQHGGDVDTIHNVRKIGSDDQMYYKNPQNQINYENRGEYNSKIYHSDQRYIDKNRSIKEQKIQGKLYDAYTGEKFAPNQKTDLDHVISAKEIHDDRGRVLAGISGNDLANAEYNLKPTNPHTNRSKKADSMQSYLNKSGDEYSTAQKERMTDIDAQAREKYNTTLSQKYYTSKAFAKDLANAAGKVGLKMGVRQALGFVFAEIWFAVEAELKASGQRSKFDFASIITSIGNGIKTGFSRAKEKYKQLFSRLIDGTIAGVLSSLTTTLCNIFFTTAKNVVRIIRESYASVVQALKILFINPDNLLFGERMRAAAKVLATGASIVAGVMVSTAIESLPIGQIPVVGEIVQTFCGTLVTGIMSCTLLYFLDRSEIVNKLVRFANKIHTVSDTVARIAEQARLLEAYAAELMQIDLEQFRKEVTIYSSLANSINMAQTETELNIILKNAAKTLNIQFSWGDDFDGFMRDKSTVLEFR